MFLTFSVDTDVADLSAILDEGHLAGEIEERRKKNKKREKIPTE